MSYKAYLQRKLPYVWASREVMMWRALTRAAVLEAQGIDASPAMGEVNLWMATSTRRYIVLRIYEEIQNDPSARKRFFPAKD